MEFDRKFENDTSCRSISLGSLEPDRAYSIVHAKCINTRCEHSVLVAIIDSPSSSVNVFLSRCYGDVVSDEDLEAINSQHVALLPIHMGTCPRSNSYILDLKRQ